MNNALLSLLQLSDPALPIGAYAHSSGLETYVQAGVVRDKGSSSAFIRAMLAGNLHYTDAALMALAHGAALEQDSDRLRSLDRLCAAVKLPKEIREGSMKLGKRLMKIFPGIGGEEGLHHYSVVFGYCAAVLGIGLREALTGFYYNAASGMVTNCVKLIPLGQLEGQQLLLGLHSLILELTERNLLPDPEMIGLACAGFDIRCMQHEQLYSRLYMS
jgi:urease accessory protein